MATHGSLWGLSYNINTKGRQRAGVKSPPGHTGQAQRRDPGGSSSAALRRGSICSAARGVRAVSWRASSVCFPPPRSERLQVLLLCFLFFLADFQPLHAFLGPPAAWSARQAGRPGAWWCGAGPSGPKNNSNHGQSRLH